MSADIERMEKYIREKHIKYHEFSEFSEIKEISSENELFGKLYKANWKQREKCVALRSIDLDNDTAKEIIREIKLLKEVNFNDMIIKFYGITKTSEKNYLFVLEYAEGETLRNYLKEEFTSLKWQDKYGLAFQLSSAIEYLHDKRIIHGNLRSNNIFIQQNSIKIADFGLSKCIRSTDKISFDTVPYDAPEGFDITREREVDSSGEDEKLKKSDVYSTGVLLWELSSGKRPFNDREYNISLAREITQGLRESIVEGTPKEYSKLYAKCWDSDPGKRPTIQEVVVILKSMISSQQTQQMIKQLKLNHGLFLDGRRIEPSKQAVLSENGILNISLCREQPLIYTYINDHGSRTNLLSFNLDDNNELNEALQPSDICINFPVAEITYNAGLLESFSNFMEGDEALYETYGHIFARKLLVGGTLLIDDFKSITLKQQIDSFKSLLTWVYNSVKYNKENPFNNLSLNFFPKLRTSGGEKLHSPEDLIKWMNKLYQDNILDVILYTNLIFTSELRLGKSSSIDAFQEKQPGIANFKEKLSLKDWVSDSIYVNLERWVKEFHLLQGIIISEYLRLEISKKTAVSFVNVPSVYLSDIFHLDMIKPTTNLEKILISNNIFPTENARDTSTFPFIKGLIRDDNLNYGNYTHFLVRRERYKILLSSLSSLDIEPSEEFKLAIEEALESMKPFVFLQNVFDEYGHLFPLSIVLGKSLKNILPNSPKKIDLGPPTFESLKLHLDNLNISYLLTKKGNIVEKTDLSNWIRDNDNLEIIGFENLISLYDILEVEQRRRIDIVLNEQDEVKIIMTGIVDLEDLDNNNIEHYKRINVNLSLKNENYKVFGSIISEQGLRMKDFSVTFGLYDFNEFSAKIKTLNNTSVNIKKCYILWMIVGNPSELSVFSPKNRDIKVSCVKESITLQPDISCYSIKTCQLSEGYTIFINYYCSTANYEPIDIKLVEWSNDSMDFQIVESNNSNESNNYMDIEIAAIIVDVRIVILSSNYKSLKVDNDEKECHLNLIGFALTENIYSINIFINELLLLYKDYSILKERDELIRKHIILKKEKENEIFNYLLSNKNKEQNIILLADFYKYGIGTEKDEIKAFELYKAAADKGQTDSIYMLGKCYQNGIGIEKNEIKAFELYKEAAKLNHELANSEYSSVPYNSFMYENGEGIDKDYGKAFEPLKQSVEKESIANSGYQNKTANMDSTNVQDNVNIIVQMASRSVLINLNLKASLSIIRHKLENNSIVRMNNTLSFAHNNSRTGKSLLAVIAREYEEKIILEQIIDKKNMILYLELESEPNWRFFKNKLKLEYGYSVTLKKANSRAFTIVNCETDEIDGYENSTIQIDLEENKIIKNDFLLIADIDIPNFAKLGVSIENLNVKNSNVANIINISEFNKMSLKFKLEPTTEFIEAVKDVIDSKNPRKFKDIINDFGQFIPKQVILGGRAYFTAKENSKDSGVCVENTGYQTLNIKIEKKSSNSLYESNPSKYSSLKLVGGKKVCSNNFNEEEWIESLNDFRNWSCIKFKDSVSIFQLLIEDMRKQILLLVGKKILYTNTEDYTYYLFEPEMHQIFKLNIPENILEMLQNKDADCSIFATIIDKKEKDVFNCQVIWTSNENPRLIIHCIQKKIKKRECKLKIRWMIVGYDTSFDFNHLDLDVKLKVLKNDFNKSNSQVIIKPLDLEYNPSVLYFGNSVLNKLDDSNNSLAIGHYFFNVQENRQIGSYIFSYCLKKNHYTNLPNFTFNILVISNYPNFDNYGILPFQHIGKISKSLNFINSSKSDPKFISLYSTENKLIPIFLKQKTSEIKIKYINTTCNQNDCICKSKRFKKLENNLKYAFFNPN